VTASAEIAKASVRRLACEILLKVDTKKSYADILLNQALKTESLTERDRSLLTELVYGTLRWRGKIDAQLSHHLRRPLEQTDGGLRNLLRLTCYQLVFLDRIPDYAAVNEAVALAKTRGGARLQALSTAFCAVFLDKRTAILRQTRKIYPLKRSPSSILIRRGSFNAGAKNSVSPRRENSCGRITKDRRWCCA
jgi:transcription termination factor NusB